ncbi:MAG: 2-hydroxychromene-2-carboxylate isomerase [Pseudomonadota bacterium]
MPPNAQPVTFYFDPISPYVWLAGKEIDRIEAAGRAVQIEPVLIAGLLNAFDIKGPAEIPVKRAHTFRDVMRLAAARGLRFRGPPGHPFNSLMALRMCLTLEQTERRRFSLALSAACWEGGQDVSDQATLREIAHQCDLDGEAMAARAGQDDIKQALRDNTGRAIAAGVFGLPTFALDGALFWGADRIDSLLWQLAGNRIDEAALNDFLRRPALAVRARPG